MQKKRCLEALASNCQPKCYTNCSKRTSLCSEEVGNEGDLEYKADMYPTLDKLQLLSAQEPLKAHEPNIAIEARVIIKKEQLIF